MLQCTVPVSGLSNTSDDTCILKDCLCKVFSPNEINVHSHIFVPKDQAVFSKDYVRARDELNTGVWEC